ncbi:hypothetical protein OG884_05920 [Streptosporangium sp. NBC_01755]|uniref:hypothetical protein n=1 Tax=Streptosporangium sp. NBC_01755 TaxID=2975949 RepID=UPI002DD8B0FA|nr:hypothetical protein [Streptosporangium sp. NBC_01755]WSD01463.1 hypothetical protein OG884_05920 [Streptosporangium sp. NBC_01755]
MQEKTGEPITIREAAVRLNRPEPTVRVWASRHHARRIPFRPGKTAWYDWNDLKTIARQLTLGLPVPKSPEERDEIRLAVRAGAAA